MRIAFMLGCEKILLMNTTRYWGDSHARSTTASNPTDDHQSACSRLQRLW